MTTTAPGVGREQPADKRERLRLERIADGYVVFECVGATPFDAVPYSPYRGVAAPGSWLSVDAWLDEDGEHVWIAHDCIGKRDVSMLPWPTWQAPRDAHGSVLPSFDCGECGVHLFARINLRLAS